MKRFDLLRSLVASLAAASPEAAPLLDNNEIVAAENPKGQPRGRLTDVAATLKDLAERLSAVEQTDDVVAVLGEVTTAAEAVQTELATTTDPATVAASLVAQVDPNTASVTTSGTAAAPRPALGRVNAPNRTASPGARSARATATVVAGGQPVATMTQLTERLHQAGKSIAGLGGGGHPGNREGQALGVVTVEVDWPPTSEVLGADAARNQQVLDARLSPQALTASGGVCAPVGVDYSIPTFATQERPLRDGLPRVPADRGGVAFVEPPALTSLDAGTVVWTEANDVALTSPATKPVAVVTCGGVTTVLVDAIPTRIQLGNFLTRFAPEQMTAQVETALASAARKAELNLLATIDTHSVETTSVAYLGATRDLLATIDLACAGVRYRQRILRSTAMRVVLPEFARDMLRADIARQLATDASQSGGGALAVSDEQIDAWFTVRGIRPIWTLDGRAAKGTSPTYPLQGFAAQTADAAVAGWPAKVVLNIFPEGSFVYLDGGKLDLGIVRDSTLNATNDAELFVEPFEAVAFRGLEALKLIATVAPNGGSAGTIAESTYTAGA